MRKILEYPDYFPRKGGITQIYAPAFVTAARGEIRTGFFAACCDTKAGRNRCSLPNKAAQFFAALQISATDIFAPWWIRPEFMGGYGPLGNFAIMLQLRSGKMAAPCFRIADKAGSAERGVGRVSEFAFPLAKRDYDCFNKAQRVPINGARLGRILSRSQVC